ncbi:hypothetical protein G7Y89_g3147 [Cudoniella acicularis]|uniref:Uncharacterized protein n=1 Tax=Cudoniella acicularis TaxID=354080 RepID=A0A8H4W5V0_9HELO|nr:hypothetical protein G7Y89_g3147 [Cudoniella acicularis]
MSDASASGDKEVEEFPKLARSASRLVGTFENQRDSETPLMLSLLSQRHLEACAAHNVAQGVILPPGCSSRRLREASEHIFSESSVLLKLFYRRLSAVSAIFVNHARGAGVGRFRGHQSSIVTGLTRRVLYTLFNVVEKAREARARLLKFLTV